MSSALKEAITAAALSLVNTPATDYCDDENCFYCACPETD